VYKGLELNEYLVKANTSGCSIAAWSAVSPSELRALGKVPTSRRAATVRTRPYEAAVTIGGEEISHAIT